MRFSRLVTTMSAVLVALAAVGTAPTLASAQRGDETTQAPRGDEHTQAPRQEDEQAPRGSHR